MVSGSVTDRGMRGNAYETGEAGAPGTRRPLLGKVSSAHLIMVVAGALAFLLVLVVLRDRTATTTVVVAATELEAGTVAEASRFRFVELPAEVGMLEGLVDPSSVAALIDTGWALDASVGEGVPLRIADFAEVAAGGGVRVMSIALDGPSAVNGALEAGDRVDIVGGDAARSEFVAVDVEVVAVDVGAGSIGRAGVTVSLVVTPDQALRITSALAGSNTHLIRSTGAPPIELAPQDDRAAGG